MFRLIFLIVMLFLALPGCNTSGGDVQVNTSPVDNASDASVGLPPSKVVEDGSCMANTLSFLVGQPETALQAMQYPDNTRILVHGQLVNSFVDPSRLNLVIGLDRNIKFVYCG